MVGSTGASRFNYTQGVVPRPYTAREEMANVATHGGGVLASLVALTILVGFAARYGDARRVLGGALFGIAATLLFTASTLYHLARRPTVRNILRKVDHCAIYVLIAATYSAFTLSVMRDRVGWSLFAAVWVLAGIGIIAEIGQSHGRARGAVLLYLAMGWIGLVAIHELVAHLSKPQLLWVLAGGICYTAGVPFYVAKSRRYTHSIWHLFVLAGVTCHFLAVLGVMRSG